MRWMVLLAVLVMSQAVPAPAEAAQFSRGQDAIVANPRGTGINVHYGSGLRYAVQRFLPNGTRVVIKGGPRTADRVTWYDITGYGNSGWTVASGLAHAPAPRPAAAPIAPTPPPAVLPHLPSPVRAPAAPPPGFAAPAAPTPPPAVLPPLVSLPAPVRAPTPAPLVPVVPAPAPQPAPVAAPAAPARRGADVRITDVTYSSRTATLADYLEIRVVVRNDGGATAETYGWDPGGRYEFYDVAPTAPRGRWRVGLECAGIPAPVDHQWRFGFGGPLAPGETRALSLFLNPTFDVPISTTCWVGIVEEQVAWHADGLGRVELRLGGGSAVDPIREWIESDSVLDEAFFWLAGFRIADTEFLSREPGLAAALVVGARIPIGPLVSKGYRFVSSHGRELLLDKTGKTVAIAASRGERALAGEVNGLAIASRREQFAPVRGFTHGVNEHGADALGWIRGRPAALESKFYCNYKVYPSHLRDEMTLPWLARSVGPAGDAAPAFSRSIANGTIYRMLIVTRCGDTVAGISDTVLERFDVAYEVSEAGKILKRYTK